MNHASLFSGIGGFDLAATWMGWQNIFQVEKDKFCQRILAQHFPQTHRYDDVKTFKGDVYATQIDVLTGGFPCQPFSYSGKRLGTDDERYLWGDMRRIIQEIRPRWVVGENVGGLLTMQNGLVFEQILLDLEDCGYQVQSFVIPAAGAGAPHRRDRVWIIAHLDSHAANRLAEDGQVENNQDRERAHIGYQTDLAGEYAGNSKTDANLTSKRSQRENAPGDYFAGCSWKRIEPTICRGYNGVSARLDRIKGLGNAVVPQVVYRIFQAIQYADNELRKGGRKW